MSQDTVSLLKIGKTYQASIRVPLKFGASKRKVLTHTNRRELERTLRQLGYKVNPYK